MKEGELKVSLVEQSRYYKTRAEKYPDPDNPAELVRAAAHPQGPIRRKFRADENDIFGGAFLILLCNSRSF